MKNFFKILFSSNKKLIAATLKELDLTARLELELYCDYLLLLARQEYEK